MTEIIKIKNSKFDEYEELINQRDRLLRDETQYNLLFSQTFGEYIIELFELQVEAIKYKKMIAYCNMQENSDKPIILSKLNEHIDTHMKTYYDDLNKVISDVKFAKEAETASDEDVNIIKKMYFKLAKLIHPDRRPDLAEDEKIKELWNRVVLAYRFNDIKSIIELAVLINKYLDDNSIDLEDFYIDNIDKKITEIKFEIEHILNNEPYTYRYILEDKEKIEEVINDYKTKIEEFKEYIIELKEIYSKFEIEGLYS